ncbi:MAG: lytic transglycosylase domain-containing protein, partial [Pseudomonadota bacterium]
MKTILSGALAAALILSGQTMPVAAEDFTFKRVAPPAPGTTKRIDIQITTLRKPSAAPRPGQPEGPDDVVARTAPAQPADRTDHQAWFWSAVSPGLEPVHGRFAKAAQVAARPPVGSGVVAPSVRQLQGIARMHGAEILRHSVGTRVSPALVLALISVESGGRIAAVSEKGATGLMQLIPATAERFGASDMRDPAQNIAAGVAYLDWLMGEFDGDPVLALA